MWTLQCMLLARLLVQKLPLLAGGEIFIEGSDDIACLYL